MPGPPLVLGLGFTWQGLVSRHRVVKFPQMSLLCSHGWMYSSKCEGNVVPDGSGK